ncbi:MAG: DUF5665 domain-containing protein [Candidatus Gracilibacteria bacterium]|jgi:uncharacterized membrane protein
MAKKRTPKNYEIERELIKEVKTLSEEVRKLKHLEFVQILKRPWKFTLLSLVKGLMIGFGSVLGATLLVAIFIYVLSKIQLVPVVGDFVESVLQEMQISTEDMAKPAGK